MPSAVRPCCAGIRRGQPGQLGRDTICGQYCREQRNAWNDEQQCPHPVSGTAADWGQAIHLALFDALTGGNAWVCSPLTTPKTINNGDSALSFAISALTFQVDN